MRESRKQELSNLPMLVVETCNLSGLVRSPVGVGEVLFENLRIADWVEVRVGLSFFGRQTFLSGWLEM